jgi:excisionase family DNA binding protein
VPRPRGGTLSARALRADDTLQAEIVECFREGVFILEPHQRIDESKYGADSHFGGWTEKPDRRSMVRMSNRSHSYLTTAEVPDILQVSPKTVTRWAREGKLPHSRTLGGHRRYPGYSIRKLATELFRSDDRFVPRG